MAMTAVGKKTIMTAEAEAKTKAMASEAVAETVVSETMTGTTMLEAAAEVGEG